MKNPPKKPKAPKGHIAHWIKPYSYRKVVSRKRDRLGRLQPIYGKVHVGGHYRFFKGLAAPAPRRRVRHLVPKGWELARDFEIRAVKEYDADHVDSIYRYSQERDVVRLSDGLVWDSPIRSDVRGTFSMARVWYVAHQFQDSDRSEIDPGKLDRYYIYVRTFDASALSEPSISFAYQTLWKTWVPRIEAEYEGKESMEFTTFLAWTVFDEKERIPKKIHKAVPRRESREKAFRTTDRGEVRRVLTRWEIKKVLGETLGTGIGLKRRKGESIKAAIERMKPAQRRRYRRALSDALQALETKWARRRQK